MRRTALPILYVLISNAAIAADTSIISCHFEQFINVEHEITSEANRVEIKQSMRIVGGRTDDTTLKLDGKTRATNSRNWKRLDIDGWESWETTFIGDFREILTLAYDLGANKKPLIGWYKASLVSPGVEHTQISLGKCLVE